MKPTVDQVQIKMPTKSGSVITLTPRMPALKFLNRANELSGGDLRRFLIQTHVEIFGTEPNPVLVNDPIALRQMIGYALQDQGHVLAGTEQTPRVMARSEASRKRVEALIESTQGESAEVLKPAKKKEEGKMAKAKKISSEPKAKEEKVIKNSRTKAAKRIKVVDETPAMSQPEVVEPTKTEEPLVIDPALSGKKKGGIRQTIMGQYSTCEIIRWLSARLGAGADQIEAVLKKLDVEIAHATVIIQSGHGRRGTHPIPELKSEEQKKLKDLLPPEEEVKATKKATKKAEGEEF